MRNLNNDKRPPHQPKSKMPGPLTIFVVLMIIWMLVNLFMQIGMEGVPKQISYSDFYSILTSGQPKIVEVVKKEGFVTGKFANGQRFFLYVDPEDRELLKLLRQSGAKVEIKPAQTFLSSLFYYFGPVLVLVLFYWFFAFRAAQGGGRLWSFGKARTRGPNPSEKVTFEDVAGVEEAKEELKEVIDFLKDPKKYQRLGGKIPKGVLLVGPPGTGKTLLAKAVAGEADVPFFSISGSDFVEMFVGVGAARVRDLFEQAKKAAATTNKGCIIYIDEIDAVGGKRAGVVYGAHEERQQTLNQLLVEMDGFDSSRGIIVMASTNRPDVLDPALLRPGRFDRRIVVDLPDMKGREAILKVHARNVKLDPSVDLERIAQQTPGFSGADLANLINEAALLAARRNKDSVTMEELEESMERVVAGPQRRSRAISPKEKKIVAYHEAGHALLSLFVDGADPLHKVSIIPRGAAALGYTLQRPTEDRYLFKKEELIARIKVLLGGRAAEEIVFGDITTGAGNDLEVATAIARKMVCRYGMSKVLGNVVWEHHPSSTIWNMEGYVERLYSIQTGKQIDEEIKSIIDNAYKDVLNTLNTHLQDLHRLANKLLEKETLSVDEIKELLGLTEGNKGEKQSSEIAPKKSVSEGFSDPKKRNIEFGLWDNDEDNRS